MTLIGFKLFTFRNLLKSANSITQKLNEGKKLLKIVTCRNKKSRQKSLQAYEEDSNEPNSNILRARLSKTSLISQIKEVTGTSL